MDERTEIYQEAAMDEWLRDRLRSAAEAATGGVVIDDPRTTVVPLDDQDAADRVEHDGAVVAVPERFRSRRSARSVVGVAAAGALLVVGALAWAGSQEKSREAVGTP